MQHGVRSSNGGDERRSIAHVALHHLHLPPDPGRQQLRPAHEDPGGHAVGDQLAYDVPPDEARGAGDEGDGAHRSSTNAKRGSTGAGTDGRRSSQRTSGGATAIWSSNPRSEEHTSELQSRPHLVCRLLLEKKKISRKC